MIHAARFVQKFGVARIFLELRFHCKYSGFEPACRDCCGFEQKIGLLVIGIALENLFNLFDCALRIFFQNTLRLN